jgi:DNA primase
MSTDAVRQIKDRISIVDVVAPYVQLQSAGKSMKGKSPFTNERTPSFFVSPDRGMFYCFSTNKGGDIFTFIEEMEGVDFKGALKILADRAGVELVPEDPKQKSERDALYEVLQKAVAFYVQKISEHTAAAAYLHKRGVLPETIEKWQIGYAPGPPSAGWREVATALKQQGVTEQQLLRTGLTKGADAGKEAYDVFRDRIMFPLFDASGRPVAFSGRILATDSEAPKYVNSPETELYNKSELLYGYDRAKQGIRTLNFTLVVEGQFDVVMSHQAGYHNTVAVSGTALTEHHVQLMQRLSSNVVLALDSDRAGLAAIKRAATLMLARGMDVKVARMPDGSDPADCVQNDVASYKRSIGQAAHVVPFLLQTVIDTESDGRLRMLKVREEVLPFVARIPSALDREYFITEVAATLGSTKDAVRLEVERHLEKVAQQSTVHQSPEKLTPKKEINFDRRQAVEQYLAVASTVLEAPLSEILGRLVQPYLNQTLTDFVTGLSLDVLSSHQFTIETVTADLSKKRSYDYWLGIVLQYQNLVFSERTVQIQNKLKQAEQQKSEEEVFVLLATIKKLQEEHRVAKEEAKAALTL